MLENIKEELREKFKNKDIIIELAGGELVEVKSIPTDIFGVDYVIGRPGIPTHKITQICGYEDTGKSLLGLKFLIAFQQRYDNGIPLLIDAEGSFDPEFFCKMGGNLEKLIVINPSSLEDGFIVFKELLALATKENYHVLGVFDSLSIAVEREKEGTNEPGLHARILSRLFREIRSLLAVSNGTLVYISQDKERISMTGFGGGTSRLGGHAVDFAPVLTLNMKRKKIRYNSNDAPEYVEFEIKATKNHVSIPFKKATLLYDVSNYEFIDGFTVLKFMVQCKNEKISIPSKGWYLYNDNKYREIALAKKLEEDGVIEEFRSVFEINYEENKDKLLEIGGN